MDIDLHGLHPNDLKLDKVIQQAWEMGATTLCLIHGHGRNRGISPGFVNTNTGYFGLQIRAQLRQDKGLRRWFKISSLDRSHEGSTTIRLKTNPSPTRTIFDWSQIVVDKPANDFRSWSGR